MEFADAAPQGVSASAAPDAALVARLRAAGCVFAEEEAAAITAAAPSPGDRERMVARRVTGEPLEVILGFAAFGGLAIPVAPGVFVPRLRTELVARLAADMAPPPTRTAPSIVVDMCCGSGAIAAFVAHARPELTVIATDVDPGAVALAARTLAAYGATALVSDMDASLPAALRGKVAVVASCPPYVPTAELALMPSEARDYEPELALDGGPDGTALQSRVFAAARRLLSQGGVCLVETSDHMADATLAAASAAGLSASLESDDERGAVVVVARR